MPGSMVDVCSPLSAAGPRRGRLRFARTGNDPWTDRAAIGRDICIHRGGRQGVWEGTDLDVPTDDEGRLRAGPRGRAPGARPCGEARRPARARQPCSIKILRIAVGMGGPRPAEEPGNLVGTSKLRWSDTCHSEDAASADGCGGGLMAKDKGLVPVLPLRLFRFCSVQRRLHGSRCCVPNKFWIRDGSRSGRSAAREPELSPAGRRTRGDRRSRV